MAREVHGSLTRSRSVARVAALSSQDSYRRTCSLRADGRKGPAPDRYAHTVAEL